MEFFASGVIVNFLARLYSARKKYCEEEIVTVHTSNDVIPEIRSLAEKILLDIPRTLTLLEMMDYHGQFQTIVQFMIRNSIRMIKNYIFIQHKICFERELVTMTDGGTVALDWAYINDKLNMNSQRPIVLLIHGLLGDSQSEYLYHFAGDLYDSGYQPIVMVCRGCGDLKHTSGSLFAGKISHDFVESLKILGSRFPSRKFYAIGFSLGAASLINSLGIIGDEPSIPKISAAVCVSPPWKISSDGKTATFLQKLWSALLTIPLKLHFIKHHKDLREYEPEKYSTINLWDILFKVKYVAHFDQLFLGVYSKSPIPSLPSDESISTQTETPQFDTIDDYYDYISPINYTSNVKVPTLVLTAIDDPICAHQACPVDEDSHKLGTHIVTVSLFP